MHQGIHWNAVVDRMSRRGNDGCPAHGETAWGIELRNPELLDASSVASKIYRR
jgi:hypothetical protein